MWRWVAVLLIVGVAAAGCSSDERPTEKATAERRDDLVERCAELYGDSALAEVADCARQVDRLLGLLNGCYPSWLPDRLGDYVGPDAQAFVAFARDENCM